MKNSITHITIVLDSQVLVNLRRETFGLECLKKTPEAYQYKICVNDVSNAIYQALQQHKKRATVVISDQDGDKPGEITGMDRADGDFRLTIRPGAGRPGIFPDQCRGA